MAITYNGVNVTSVVYNGNTVNSLVYNGTEAFSNSGDGGNTGNVGGWSDESEAASLDNVDPSLLGNFGNGVALSPDESLIAITGDGNTTDGYVQVYQYDNYEIGQPVGTPIAFDRAWDAGSNTTVYGWGSAGKVAFSGDNQTLAISDSGKGVVVFNLVNDDWQYNAKLGEGWNLNDSTKYRVTDIFINSDGTNVWWGQPFGGSLSRGQFNQARFDGSSWQETTILPQTSTLSQSDYYGYSNAILEEDANTYTLVTAAHGRTGPTSGDQGEVYAFRTTDKGVTWTEIFKAYGAYDITYDSGGANTRDKLGQGITATLSEGNIIFAANGQYSSTCFEIDTGGTLLFRQKQDLINDPNDETLTGFSNVGVFTQSNQLILPFRNIISKWDLVPLADRTDGFMFANNEVTTISNTTSADSVHGKMYISELSGLVVYGDPANDTIFTIRIAFPKFAQSGIITLEPGEFELAYDSSVITQAHRDDFNAGNNILVPEPVRDAAGFWPTIQVGQFQAPGSDPITTDPMRFQSDGSLFFPGVSTEFQTGNLEGMIQSGYAGSPNYFGSGYRTTPKSGYVWFKPVRIANGTSADGNNSQYIFNDAFHFRPAGGPNNGGCAFYIKGYDKQQAESTIATMIFPSGGTNMIAHDNYGMNTQGIVHTCEIYKDQLTNYNYEDWHLLVWSVVNSPNGEVGKSEFNIWFDGSYYNQTRVFQSNNIDWGLRPYREIEKSRDELAIGARSWTQDSTIVQGRNFRGYIHDFKIYVNKFFDQADADTIWAATRQTYGR